jgi:hypothetical protein
MSNVMVIALIFTCSFIVSALAWMNSRSEQQNVALFATTGELKAPRYLVVIFLALATAASLMAIRVGHNRMGDPSWPMALFGLGGPVFALIHSFFGVRLGKDDIHFGWRCQQSVGYADVVEMERRSDGRNASLTLVLRSGVRRRIGSSLPCEWLIIDELQARTGCSVTYRLRGRIVPKPEWLELQSKYARSKSGPRK